MIIMKGVLADYAEAKEKTRLRREARAEALYLQMKVRVAPALVVRHLLKLSRP